MFRGSLLLNYLQCNNQNVAKHMEKCLIGVCESHFFKFESSLLKKGLSFELNIIKSQYKTSKKQLTDNSLQ